LEERHILAKFISRTKRNIRKLNRSELSQSEADNEHLKIGLVICNVEEYIQANRSFKCSRYNPRLADSRVKETCPLCTGRHKLRECTSLQRDFKCINCMIYNNYNRSKTICTNHSSVDKNCPNLQAQLTKYKLNTDF